MNSIWSNSIKHQKQYPSLSNNITTKVCIIGGGMTGITTAYYLNQENMDFILVEKGYLHHKATTGTTGKLTYAHDLCYRYLMDSYSKELASQYLHANFEAIEEVKRIVEKEQIDCDFARQSEFYFTQKEENVQTFKDEYTALKKLGANCELVNDIPLSLPIKIGLHYHNQAMFHPLKYVEGLLKTLPSTSLYEHTDIIDIKKSGDQYVVDTKDGYHITCDQVVMATKYPIKDIPGFYFAKLYQETSYIIAIQTKQPIFNGMYNSSDTPNLSFRTATYQGKEIVLVAGNNNKTGENISLKDKYDFLEDTAKKIYPDAKVLLKWNTEDTISLDKIPYIGSFSRFLPHCYVATGFKKWGMTTANIAANIITDAILGKTNPYCNLFKATRFQPLKNRKELGNMVKQTTYSLCINRFKIKEETLASIPKGQGKILRIKGKIIGVYHDINDKWYGVNPFCTHLGCMLHFNDLDITWDCPCHGSRFHIDGTNLYNPASYDLEKIDITTLIPL